MLKKIIKVFFPKVFIKYIKNIKETLELKKFKKLPLEEVFKLIYNEKIWTPENQKKNFKYYSGLGSHKSEFVEEYLSKVIFFIKSLETKPTILELGCGDFNVSSKLVEFSSNYIACDIFEDLIEINKKKFVNSKLRFLKLDMTKDELPEADICIVRCVLQHLSNKMINNFLRKIKGKFKHIIITEHYPSIENFNANYDIISGPNIRLRFDSAVVLTKPPFNLEIKYEKNICKIYSKSIQGYLNTQLYQLK